MYRPKMNVYTRAPVVRGEYPRTCLPSGYVINNFPKHPDLLWEATESHIKCFDTKLIKHNQIACLHLNEKKVWSIYNEDRSGLKYYSNVEDEMIKIRDDFSKEPDKLLRLNAKTGWW
jgi:hypothetical protein